MVEVRQVVAVLNLWFLHMLHIAYRIQLHQHAFLATKHVVTAVQPSSSPLNDPTRESDDTHA